MRTGNLVHFLFGRSRETVNNLVFAPLIRDFFFISLMMMVMMMNCFCSMVDRRKAFSLISSRDHCQRSSPSRISDTPPAGFEPAQNLSSGLIEWSCAIVITTTSRCHYLNLCNQKVIIKTFLTFQYVSFLLFK